MTFAPVPRSGIVAALDVTTNKIVWRFRWADQCYSGLLATGGSLLFVGRADGRLTALDSTTGTQLWEFQTGAGMHAPVSTFERNGKQYVIAYSAGSALIGSARGDSVWLFALDGKLPPATAGRAVSRLEGAANPAPAAANPTPAAANPTPVAANSTPGVAAAVAAAIAAANPVRGKELYEQACVVCHGADGKGGHGVGAPLTGVTDFAAVFRTVGEGRNTMPPFKASFTADQIRDVSAYVVQTLSATAK